MAGSCCTRTFARSARQSVNNTVSIPRNPSSEPVLVMDAHQPRRPTLVPRQALHQLYCSSCGHAPDLTLILEVATVPIENEIEAVRAMEVVGRHDVLHLTTTASAMLGEWDGRLLRGAFGWHLPRGGTKPRAAGLGPRSHLPAQAADTAPRAAGLPRSARLP